MFKYFMPTLNNLVKNKTIIGLKYLWKIAVLTENSVKNKTIIGLK